MSLDGKKYKYDIFSGGCDGIFGEGGILRDFLKS